MNRNKRTALYISVATIFILSVIFYRITSPKGEVIVIKSDGQIIETVNLNAVTEDYEFDVLNDGYNKIEVTSTGVKVTEADCPDKLCIKQSESEIYPIVCLPHKLVIEICK